MPSDLPGVLITAGTAVSCAAFLFCVIASSYGWNAAVTGPGTAASVVALTVCVLVSHLRGGAE